MTTPARIREAERATVALQVALARLGAATVEDALDLWLDINPTDIPGTVEKWHADAIQLVLTRRGTGQQIALAYYRLIRALRTGRTVPRPGEPVKTSVTLAELRREFSLLLREVDQLYTGPASSPDALEVRVEELSARDEYDHLKETEGNGDPIPQDSLDDSIEQALADQEQEALDETEDVLATLGPENLDKKLRDLDDTRPAREVDADRDRAFDEAGARQASAAERLAMNGGRETVVRLLNADRRSLGFARISLTGSPCGWCAMLISRGAVYRSAGTATRANTLKTADNVAAAEAGAYANAFHDNCHCITVPVFSRDELETGTTFALNRELDALWQREVWNEGYRGDAAIARFRQLMRVRARSAARPTDAQEAAA